MNNIRVRFIRDDEVKFISHLDLMKTFERALRRSGLPIAYSQGFNPHPQMVFGLPLSVGVSSEAEYAEFELTEDMTPEAFAEILNKQLPKGLRILDGKQKQRNENIMAAISAASFIIQVSAGENHGKEWFGGKIHGFLEQPSIIVKKEGKKGVRDVDIRPWIYMLEISKEDKEKKSQEYIGEKFEAGPDAIWLSMLAAAGSVANLKPELMIAAFQEFSGVDIKILKIHRTGLYIVREGKFLQPLSEEVI